MQNITAGVGEGATNSPSDVALVQAILVLTTRAAAPGRPAARYLASYDGAYGRLTRQALEAFQQDHVFVAPGGLASLPNPRATAGQVRPGDATWEQLLAQVPAAFANLRVLPGGRIVYLEAIPQDVSASLGALALLTYAPAFRLKVRACIERMHALHGIAIAVCPQGDRRSFQAQYNLLTGGGNVTNAGPGESNHNYGMAADLGFPGLRWLHRDGTTDVGETAWLHHLSAQSEAQALVFWEALRSVGTSPAVNAFRGPQADRPHLQNWDDAHVSMRARLAAHLQASGTMRWSVAGAAYRCDLGLGDAQTAVGTAAQVWNLQATVTAPVLTPLRNAAAAAAGKAPPPPAGAADVQAMRQALRDQFDLADANWQAWTAQ